jgi:predicted metalloprotease with PDZ domain
MSAKPLHYRIQAAHPEAHLYSVTLSLDTPDPAGQRLFMPAWIPGSYMIRDFARHVVTLQARGPDGPVRTRRHDKNTWVCAPCDGVLTVDWEVYAWDLSVRAAHLDTTHGYFNGTSVFLCPMGQEGRPCVLDLQAPHGTAYRDWRVATTLARQGAAPLGFGTYRADNYDDLIDHPVEMGRFTLARFDACGVPHDIAITGRHRADTDRLCADLTRICEHHIRFFGVPAPVHRYLFQVQAVGEGYGGLEHRASTSLLCSRKDLPRSGDGGMSDEYRGFLGLCSHEYFHTWNVKRIKPAAFSPYRLDRECHTRLLWAFEGITSYYDDLALRRSGLISRAAYLELLGQTATRVWRGSGRHKQTVADSSFDAWTKFYKQDENAPNAIVSYYTKGALVALCLDLTIRTQTGGEASLDSVMHLLWRRYGASTEGVPESAVETVATEVAGADLSPFFDRALRSTDDLPLQDLLTTHGVEMHVRAAAGALDKGGGPASGPLPAASLGARGKSADGGVRLTHVLDQGAAQSAGLSAGDLVVALDDLRVGADATDLEHRIAASESGQRIRVHAFRRDELMLFEVELQPPPDDTVYFTVADPLDPARLRRLEQWLGP